MHGGHWSQTKCFYLRLATKYFYFYQPVREVLKRNWKKAVRLTALGIWFLDTQIRFYFIVKRLKNAFLMYIYKVRIRNFDKSKICLWFTTGRGVRGGLWSKNSFLGKIRFKSYIIKNQSRKSKSKFFTFSWPLDGGGSTQAVSLTAFSQFICLTPSQG